MSLTKVLIANRGEIAVRIIRAARDAGIRTVAVYADSELSSVHVHLADEAYALDGNSPADTYLDAAKLIAVAHRSGCDAVHPGYGFLSESAAFAAAVQQAGLIWIGPDPEAIELLGDKARARALAAEVSAPLVPGTNSPVSSADEIVAFAAEHGLPVAIKAVHGGGGRGMRVVHELTEIPDAYASAVREATAAFGDGACLVERFLVAPRHIEAQVLADRHGRVAVLGTRDCSLQRRNQKLVEEAPAPFLSDELRERIHAAAADICRAAHYVGAGTVEFLLGNDGTLTFLEVNTRLQVEHPVTEAITGIDLVREQFRISQGEAMRVPDEIPTFGHAIEFRVNAEDPALGYLPTPGTIDTFVPPSGPGVRVDTGYEAGQTVPGTFDSLLAKLIVWGRDREEALERSRRALAEFEITGVATVLPFARHVVHDPAFVADVGEFRVHTRWIEDECAATFAPAEPVAEPATSTLTRFTIEIDGRAAQIGVPETVLAGLTLARIRSEIPSAEPAPTPGAVIAPFAATLSNWVASDGAHVAAGDTIALLEAMKMEVPVRAERAGTLRHLVEASASVSAHAVIAHIDPDGSP